MRAQRGDGDLGREGGSGPENWLLEASINLASLLVGTRSALFKALPRCASEHTPAPPSQLWVVSGNHSPAACLSSSTGLGGGQVSRRD